jgi:hypothetical protein
MKKLNSCGAYESLPIIISYDVPFSVRQMDLLLQALDYEGYTRNLGCIQGIACSMEQRQLFTILKNDHIVHAEYDSNLRCCLNSARYWSGVDMAIRDFRLTGCIPSPLGCGTGESIVVAVVDTGVDCNHVDLLGKVRGWRNLMGSEMMIIAAVVIGGTRITGGHGTVIGTILGLLLITLVSSNLIMLGIPNYWQTFAVGLIIVIGTSITSLRAKKIALSPKI